jgi:hypothetical protein
MVCPISHEGVECFSLVSKVSQNLRDFNLVTPIYTLRVEVRFLNFEFSKSIYVQKYCLNLEFHLTKDSGTGARTSKDRNEKKHTVKNEPSTSVEENTKKICSILCPSIIRLFWVRKSKVEVLP